MLELKDIVKDYPAGEEAVHALKGVTLQFRESDFVSILGPSGCGKTTLLNIIGGLDQYTSGDLVIDGISTRNYRDRDWDAYRNHSIGFVFQSYNLIPHQTVLQNVELALTLSGVSKKERRTRAKEALEQVGLSSQLSKKPNEMSGGQMQRVAIARALVNNPDIILADEPTGALDTETSVQVMEILKRVSKDRLVIMVTHNPDLANRYSTRIIRMLDGVVTSDSHPLSEEELSAQDRKEQGASAGKRRKKMPSMSFGTAFMLSLKNLFTKKGRTALTSFAGSIGIIGIALILAISQGMTAYIDATQEEALSSYPLTIQRTTVDLSSLMATFMNVENSQAEHEKDAVYKKPAIANMVNALNDLETQENDLVSFKKYMEEKLSAAKKEDPLYQAVNGVQYTYDLPLEVYTKNVDGTVLRSDTSQLMRELLSEHMGMDLEQSPMSAMQKSMGFDSISSGTTVGLWQELLPGKDGDPVNQVLKKQYDLLYGSWPERYNEIVLVVDENNELDDLTLYALGLESKEEIDAIMEAAVDGNQVETEEKQWTYPDICGQEFRVVLNSSCYAFDESTGLFADLRKTSAGVRYLYDNAIKLKVTGVIRPNEDAAAAILTGSVGYTSMLTEHVILESQKAQAISEQRETPSTDVITGLPFQENTGSLTDKEKEEAFRAYIDELKEEEKAQAYVDIMCVPSQETVDDSVAQTMQGMDREKMEETLISGLTSQMGVNEQEITSYVDSMSDEELRELMEQMTAEQVKAQYAAQMQQQLAPMGETQRAQALKAALPDYTTEQCALYYDEVLTFSESSYEENLLKLGYVDLDDPATVNLYSSSFANKEFIEEMIASYNEGVEEMSKIKYTDYVGIMMASITTIIDAITYVLIAFVAISLVVSSIMIGVITLISVQERTKEIGILRAIGASKHNVSSMFNAETVILGFSAGLLGVLITYLLCIPINSVLHTVTGISTLSAILPWPAAVILVLISVLLTLVSGVIPSRSAAKKDPVVALRTE